MYTESGPGRGTYAGLFLTTLCTLMYEILLTRIFSVTVWYHFAFMAISVAIFGMSAGAVVVYLFPRLFRREHKNLHLTISSLLFSLSIPASFFVLLNLPSLKDQIFLAPGALVLTYTLTAIPFFFGGICVCIALTMFPRNVSKLYAADLIGSALGCVVLIQIVSATDAPTAVIITAFLACVGSFCFAVETRKVALVAPVLACALTLVSFAAWHSYLLSKDMSVLRLKWVKGRREPETYLYERWNSFSRVTVSGNPSVLRQPFGWGLSLNYPADLKVKELKLEIDGMAGTILTGFDGDLQKLDHLRYDVTNIVHYILPESDVLVVGVGGGRDALSALVFQQKSVTGIEMNDAILSALNDRFGDFTGHLDRNPRVTFVADEARSWITRQPHDFDIIQLSLIDTWAATSAGAYVLAENSLYTTEAWKIFLNHLSPSGILTVSRWYHTPVPAEMYRLASLAAASLKEHGIRNPRNHIIIVRRMLDKERTMPDGVGTLLLSERPFTRKAVDTVQRVCDDLGFEMVLSPTSSLQPAFKQIVSGKGFVPAVTDFPLNLTAPTDDNPFFFNMLRLRDAFNSKLWEQGNMSFNLEGIFVLAELLVIVTVLTLLCLILPLVLKRRNAGLKGSYPLFVYFAGIGFGFLLVEISQMQRLIVFLGHPTYGLSVVLFSLLLSSGIGSYLTEKVEGSAPAFILRFLSLLVILFIYGVGTPYVIDAFEGSTTSVRILAAMAILFPLGIFMGMAFPIGMRVAEERHGELTPWLWAINGTTSVTASVLGVAISINWGISSAFWVGFTCYGFTFLSLCWMRRAEWMRSVARIRGSFTGGGKEIFKSA